MWPSVLRPSRISLWTRDAAQNRQVDTSPQPADACDSGSGIEDAILEAMNLADDMDAVVTTIRHLVQTQYQDEPAFVAELVAGYQRSVPVCLRSIADRLEHDDVDGLVRTARSLKSTSRLLGLEKLAALCRALEAIKTAPDWREPARSLQEAIRNAYALARPVLDRERMQILHESALRP